MEDNEWEVVEAGIDYVTLTAKSAEDIARLKTWADDAFFRVHLEGNQIKPSAPMGYVGWQVGPVFGGSRYDGYMVRVSGPQALEAFVACYSGTVKCTRIDIQVTVRRGSTFDGYGEWIANNTISNRKILKGQNWPSVAHLNTFGRGDTVNIGKRHCRRYGRVYNKFLESGSEYYQNCWRFEVEYKAELATMYADALKRCNGPREIAVRTFDQFRAWGVPLPSVPLPIGAPPLQAPKPQTDAERKLNWLKKQVSPTIEWLREAGYDGELATWLAECYAEGVES